MATLEMCLSLVLSMVLIQTTGKLGIELSLHLIPQINTEIRHQNGIYQSLPHQVSSRLRPLSLEVSYIC